MCPELAVSSCLETSEACQPVVEYEPILLGEGQSI